MALPIRCTMNPKIIQILACQSHLYALDEAGNTWEMSYDQNYSNKRWRLVIPHSKEKEVPQHFAKPQIP